MSFFNLSVMEDLTTAITDKGVATSGSDTFRLWQQNKQYIRWFRY